MFTSQAPKINKPTVKHKGQGSGKWEPILRFITEDELAMLNTWNLRRLNKFIDIDVFAILEPEKYSIISIINKHYYLTK